MLVIDYLNRSAADFPHKTAFVDNNRAITYLELQVESHHLAMPLIDASFKHKPVAIFLDKSVECIAAFLGVAFSGNFYTPLDTKMPISRISKIIDTLQPTAIITDNAHYKDIAPFTEGRLVILYETAQTKAVDLPKIQSAVEGIIDTDVLYVLFTSGSTGTPKGVVISQRAVIDFTEWGTEYFHIDSSYIFGNQTPFYFSMSVFDIYQTLRNAATLYVIPHQAFSFPVVLMQYLYDHEINTLNWVPSALNMISSLGALNMPHLPKLKNIFFGGEVMPMKQLNLWREEYPDVRYANLYGPTEVTDTCTCYIVNRHFENNERLPMGVACKNMDVFLLDERDQLIKGKNIGEVCVRGTGLAYGYYNDLEKTQETFMQNPLNGAYPEIIYRTGDLAQYNEYGELVYISRKDFQIKHMGHRIELGEIEAVCSSIDGVNASACLYDSQRQKIVMFYSGTIEERALQQNLKDMVPEYMLPNKRIHLQEMPLNLNGKIDRQKLKGLF